MQNGIGKKAPPVDSISCYKSPVHLKESIAASTSLLLRCIAMNIVHLHMPRIVYDRSIVGYLWYKLVHCARNISQLNRSTCIALHNLEKIQFSAEKLTMKYFLAFNASICKGLLCTSGQAKSWRETAPNISTSCSVCPEPVLLQMCPASYQPSNGCKIMFLSKYIFPAAGLCLELARMFAFVFGSRVCEGCVHPLPGLLHTVSMRTADG